MKEGKIKTIGKKNQKYKEDENKHRYKSIDHSNEPPIGFDIKSAEAMKMPCKRWEIIWTFGTTVVYYERTFERENQTVFHCQKNVT